MHPLGNHIRQNDLRPPEWKDKLMVQIKLSKIRVCILTKLTNGTVINKSEP